MMRHHYLLVMTLALVSITLYPGSAYTQTAPPSGGAHTRQTAAQASVTFRHQPATVGTRLWQHVTFFANTLTTYRQSGQVISRRQLFTTCEQIRRILVRETGPARHLVEVTYEKAQETRATASQDAYTEPQVVAGKCYRVSRERDELQVRDQQGNAVSPEEERIVKQNMQAVGRPNALAEFLHGRTMHTGQVEELPQPVVEQLLGWQDLFGDVQSVTLTLDQVKSQGATQIAECRLEIQCAPIPELEHATKMEGTIELQVDTCRAQSTALKADLNVREQRGPAELPFFVTHEGQANVHAQMRVIR